MPGISDIGNVTGDRYLFYITAKGQGVLVHCRLGTLQFCGWNRVMAEKCFGLSLDVQRVELILPLDQKFCMPMAQFRLSSVLGGSREFFSTALGDYIFNQGLMTS
ncbi:hypothetical protein U1Q18_047321 [Sarracenia purpurea var. burkii]